MVTTNSPKVSGRHWYANLSSSHASPHSLMRNGLKPNFFFLTSYHPCLPLHFSWKEGNMSGLWCDIHIFFPRFPTSGEKNRCNRSLSSAPLLTHGLPRGEKGPLAVEGLCEGVAKCDHTSLAARAAALHYHAGHLH